ncbi:MAG: class I SAM-dependent methyltransferase [Rhodanobacter sp.]|jgi:SAM-dependent methyltransferase|nr:class I SAM-dependent methyltransferase [Rhodanobacter sp.]
MRDLSVRDESSYVINWRCRVCDNRQFAQTYWAREQLFGFDEVFEYKLCSSCGCLQIVVIPDDLDRYYGSDYYSMRSQPKPGGLKEVFIRARNRYLSGQFDVLGALFARLRPFRALASLRPLRLSRGVRILDVGCGRGELLQALQSAGFTRLSGVDPFVADDLDLGGGVKIRRAQLSDVISLIVNGDREPFDVVMFHHSLEHIDDAAGALRAAYTALRPDGDCIVRIPTVSSYAWRHYGINWCGFSPPCHFMLHSRDSIVLLAERCGFKVTNITDDADTFQFWGSEQCQRRIPLMRQGILTPMPGQFTASELRGFERRAAELNRQHDGDQIIVYLKRPA